MPSGSRLERNCSGVVAAMMVELTASRDGDASPIYNILKGSEDPVQPGSTEPSLAARAREMLAGNG